MRMLASQEAVKLGARTYNVNGNPMAGYWLEKDRLQRLFATNGFNIKGVGWLNMISQWRYVGEFLPPEFALKNPESDWAVGFLLVGDDARIDLYKYAKANNIEKVLG